MSTLKSLALASVLALAPFAALAGNADDTAKAMDASLRDWMQAHNIPAASLAVAHDGHLVRWFGHGIEGKEAHPVASLSKAITAACIAHLVDDGELSFDDRIGKVLRQTIHRMGTPVDPRFENITIAQLLTHRAGLVRNAFGNATTMEQAFRITMHTMLQADPGGAMSYSNVGYLTLGMIIKEATGQDYESYCRAKVLARMGADGFIDPKMPQRAANGGWEISAADYAKFIQAFDEKSHLFGTASENFLMNQPGGDNPFYSLGVNVKHMANGTEFYHNGEVADGEGGGSYFLKTANDYTAVVIWEGSQDAAAYSDLFKRMKSTLLSGD